MTTQPVNIGPRIVRAWFDSVINPLIDALGSETATLKDRNLTWRFRPAGFEWIRRIGSHIDPRVSANLEHLLALYPGIGTAFREHDKCVDSLQREVQQLQEVITANPEFRQCFNAITSPDSLQKLGVSSPTELFGAYPKEDWIRVIAQYVINGSGELQFHYATARLWNTHRHELLPMLHAATIGNQYESVLALADKLLEIDTSLLDELKDLRLSLSLDHDQPFVEAEAYRP